MDSQPIVVEQSFSVQPDVVWQAVTEPDLMRQWNFEQIADFRPELFEPSVTNAIRCAMCGGYAVTGFQAPPLGLVLSGNHGRGEGILRLHVPTRRSAQDGVLKSQIKPWRKEAVAAEKEVFSINGSNSVRSMI